MPPIRTASIAALALLLLQPLLLLAQMTSLAMRPHGVSEEYILLRYLLTNYSKVARPVARSNEAVLVLARLFPIKLLNMYEKNEVLEMTMRLQLTWRDRMLVWHANDFNNQSTVVIPGGQLWIPDLQIVNSVSDLYALLRDQKFDFKVHSDGSVWWHPTGNLVTRCELQLMFFPFDYQRCPIMLESAIYSHTQLNLTVRVDRAPVSLSMYAESGHWDLLKVTGQPRVLWVTNSTAFTRVEFWLYLGRKTTYFKMNIIFPCCMLSGLQMLTFFFPLESTERVPEATSILLSVIVFQTMIVDQLPRSSNSIPLLCIYVDMLTGISVLAVAEAVIVASLVSRKGMRTKAPKWAHGFLRFIYKWNSDTSQPSSRRRSRTSLAFLRNSLAFQSFFGSSSLRRRKGKGSTSSGAIVLDNVNASNIGANSKADDTAEASPYRLRKSSESTVGGVEMMSTPSKPILHYTQSSPSVTLLPGNGQVSSSVKFLPTPGNQGLDYIGEDSSSATEAEKVSIASNRRQRLLNLQQHQLQPQLSSPQIPFDAPLADFDPDSSLMMTSSMLGSFHQQCGYQLNPARPSNATGNNGSPGQLTMDNSLIADMYVDDANSIEDTWITAGVSRSVDPNALMTSSTHSYLKAAPQQQPASKSNAELSPLLAPKKLHERQYTSAKKQQTSLDLPGPSPGTMSHRQALAAVAAAAGGPITPQPSVSRLHVGRTSSYASTSVMRTPGGASDRRGDSQGDLSLMLPGLPRQPCMRRSRPSLFIPSADSDDIILDWIYLARVLDAFMFLICLTVVIVVPVVLFGILPPTTVD